jgi:peroxiredoxin|tara:strand:- start:136 stop:603 length:468 start_codon:yes stop_codon:yes gene_type:complete
MALEIGSKSPNFTLNHKNASGLSEVTLSDNFGKQNTVLLFFPLAFTSVCVAEMCSISEDLSAYNDLNAKVYGISVDSPFALEVMAEQQKINFPLLSDFNKEVSSAYEVLFEELLGFKGVSKRSAFVVNKEGLITYSWSSDNPQDLPDFEELKKSI